MIVDLGTSLMEFYTMRVQYKDKHKRVKENDNGDDIPYNDLEASQQELNSTHINNVLT